MVSRVLAGGCHWRQVPIQPLGACGVCVSEFSHLGCTYGLISRPRVWAPFVSGFPRHPWNLEETRCKTLKEN